MVYYWRALAPLWAVFEPFVAGVRDRTEMNDRQLRLPDSHGILRYADELCYTYFVDIAIVPEEKKNPPSESGWRVYVVLSILGNLSCW